MKAGFRALLLGIAGEPGAGATYDVSSSSETLLAHRARVLARKTALRRAIERRDAAIWAAHDRWCRARGAVVEVGAGLARVSGRPVVHTDIYPSPAVDCLASALALPFPDRSLSGIVAIHTLHHLQDPAGFFREAARSLAPGGVLLVVEPNHNALSRFIFGRFHPERFDREQAGWKQMLEHDNDANQALSYVIFERDRARFQRELPRLEICESEPLESLSFILTGGYLLRQMAPTRVIGGVAAVGGARALRGLTAVHRLIVLRARE